MKILKAWTAAAFLSIFLSASLVSGQEGRFMIDEETISPGTKFMTGGVGKGEREAMEKMAGQVYDLKLVFATLKGNYLSFVDVKIKDQAGKTVIAAESNGPWFYADLPPGNYQVTASLKGVQKTEQVTVAGELKQVYLHWDKDQLG